MGSSELLQWHYMVFLIPFGVAALLLLVSTIQAADGDADDDGSDGDGDADADGDDGGDSDGDGDDVEGDNATRSGQAGSPRPIGVSSMTRGGRASGTGPSGLAGLLGVGRAPTTILAESFCLVWGLAGFCANRVLLHDPAPSLSRVLPSFGIALLAALIGTRIAGEVFTRLLPHEASTDVSRDALYGLTGRVTFPVSETGGRVRVYDPHGAIHDEACRVAPGSARIAKGSSVLVMDRSPQGYLIVEERRA